MLQSILSEEILEIESKFTLSDGTAGGLEKRSITFPLCKSFIDRSILVSEQDIKKAMKLYFKYENQIIEGAAGVAIAALLKLDKEIVDKRIGVVICGGNIQKTLFNSIVNNQNKVLKYILIAILSFNLVKSEEKKDLYQDYSDPFKYISSSKIGDNPFPTNPLNDRAIGYFAR